MTSAINVQNASVFAHVHDDSGGISHRMLFPPLSICVPEILDDVAQYRVINVIEVRPLLRFALWGHGRHPWFVTQRAIVVCCFESIPCGVEFNCLSFHPWVVLGMIIKRQNDRPCWYSGRQIAMLGRYHGSITRLG